jgi:hypothetical protein
MSTPRFVLLLLATAAIGIFLLFRQHKIIEQERENLRQKALSTQSDSFVLGPAKSPSAPSPELLSLRNEVTWLNRELREAPATKTPSPPELAAEWQEVHSGPAPKDQPGFVSITRLTYSGNQTPSAGFQTFQFALRNQNAEPLTPTKMKEIFDVPEGFDDPNARYSIGLGEGIGSEIGYRIVREQILSTNEVKLILDFQTADDASIRQEKILVHRNGKWRVKPESVQLAK